MLKEREPMSNVGIFWVYHGQIIVAAVPLHEGLDDGEFINGPYDHLPYWEVVRRIVPACRMLEYDSVPRGRVLYKKAEGRSYVYMDTVLHRKEVTAMLRRHFELPAETVFQTDIHYTTDPEAVERLFDDYPSR
jgi:hypothetical protein